MNKAKTAARIVFGLLWLIFGLNFFFNFLPPQPPVPEEAMKFLGGLMANPYMFPTIKSLEIIVGLMLVANIAVPLALVLIAPITVNILLFHAILAPAGMGVTLLMVILNVFLGVAYFNSYKPLFKKV
ncbi:hypothetical protein AZI86_03160 [Bdellovibrio bacteriovorus]|uniref:Acyltransferase n=1 Tax=Bdellovibrio bacteriovorus TaxID=959 RepID=A0A150WP57_BDEBC|nr:hypothetical protein [Bdellovibrio bacteriovorus]KYG66079.1 hypothetical protein AZI86_03160 [Bdellovibrio bacteriovorus]